MSTFQLLRKIILLYSLVLISACGKDEEKQTDPPAVNTLPNNPGDSDNSQPGSEDAKVIDPCYKAETYSCSAEAEILRLVNAERTTATSTRKALPLLKIGGRLSFAARKWSENQALSGAISHAGFPSERLKVISSEFGTSNLRISAENVGLASGNDDPLVMGALLFKMWKESPGHYQNMMGSAPSIGIGIIKSGKIWYGTQIFGVE